MKETDMPLYRARVSVQHKGMYKVLCENSELQAEISGKLYYDAQDTGELPVVGDFVLIDRESDEAGNAVIHQVFPRKSAFTRKAAGSAGNRQVIAANVDLLFICMALNSDYNLRRLERYLSIAWDSMATPLVLLTKADLCDDLPAKIAETQRAAIGVEVLPVSLGHYESLYAHLTKGHTVAFVGSSGVGKSTIINHLLGKDCLRTAELRNDGKGKHTTTHRELFVLENGAVVIDTPGMRELQIQGADLAKAFSDIEDLAENCRFKDCKHEAEPGCAVRAALDEGALSSERLESYQKLLREMVFEERKSTMTAAQAEKAKYIDMLGSLAEYKRIQKANRKNKF